jgi:plasmid stabilization system protein ParE
MKVRYHPAVQQDVNRALQRYDHASPQLGDAFWAELNLYIEAAATNPLRFHPYLRGLRRVNLKRFPYHFLYRVFSDRIRIVAVRHHKQHPNYGIERR